MKDFLVIGNITNDLIPTPHLGGGVSYSGFAIKKLGGTVSMITVANSEHKYIRTLLEMGINVETVPPENESYRDKVTTMVLNYNSIGQRTINVEEIQGKVYIKPSSIELGSSILVAPIINEFDYAFVEALKSRGKLFITMQGFFRYVKDGKIINHRPDDEKGFLKMVSLANLVIFSEEDMIFNEKVDHEYIKEIKRVSNISILTRGEKGIIIFQQGKLPIEISAFRLNTSEIKDFTGAGDCCAASFIWYFSKYKDLKTAGVFACLYSALKIAGLGGGETGLETIPSIEQVRTFIHDNKNRYDIFLQKNGVNLNI